MIHGSVDGRPHDALALVHLTLPSHAQGVRLAHDLRRRLPRQKILIITIVVIIVILLIITIFVIVVIIIIIIRILPKKPYKGKTTKKKLHPDHTASGICGRCSTLGSHLGPAYEGPLAANILYKVARGHQFKGPHAFSTAASRFGATLNPKGLVPRRDSHPLRYV